MILNLRLIAQKKKKKIVYLKQKKEKNYKD